MLVTLSTPLTACRLVCSTQNPGHAEGTDTVFSVKRPAAWGGSGGGRRWRTRGGASERLFPVPASCRLHPPNPELLFAH